MAGHSPALAGKCTAGVGAAVCAAGYCDVDDKCGFIDGHGPCSQANAATVCRSGNCTATNVCLATSTGGGCTADVQCLSSQYCSPQSKTCLTKIANGQPLPTEDGHDPPLTGQCTAAAAAVVCAAGACDSSDGKCGLIDGHGPCGNSAAVCRSGVCAGDGDTCGNAPVAPPPPVQVGCKFDYECQHGQFCDNQAKACKDKLANGQLLPTIAGHFPALAGTCNSEIAPLVCVSATCDVTDQKCGFSDGHGSCTEANGAGVCRSGACASNGACAFGDDGSFEGGGCSMPRRTGGALSLLGVLAALAIAATARRSRRA
jgi:hypothetical protein